MFAIKMIPEHKSFLLQTHYCISKYINKQMRHDGWRGAVKEEPSQ